MQPTGVDEGVSSLGDALDRERREADEILQETFVVQPQIDVEALEMDELEAGPSLTRLVLLAGLAVGAGLLTYALFNRTSGPRRRLLLRNRFEALTSAVRARREPNLLLSARAKPDVVTEDPRLMGHGRLH